MTVGIATCFVGCEPPKYERGIKQHHGLLLPRMLVLTARGRRVVHGEA